MNKRIAIISEHASPLSTVGGVDAGGQNIYVGHVARQLARQGHQVDIFTRRTRAEVPEIVHWDEGVQVVQVPAGPPREIRKEDLLPHMREFTDSMIRFFQWRKPGYDIMHANFWMSGMAAMELKRIFRVPFVITFHALGRVRRLYQGEADQFSDERFAIEDGIVREADAIIAECPQDEQDLLTLYSADPARLATVPCGFDPAELRPVTRHFARLLLDLDPVAPILLQLGRIVPRKGIDTVIRALSRLVYRHHIPAQLLVVGGDSQSSRPETSSELQRLQRIAQEEAVEKHVTFVGSRGRGVLPYYYSAADAFITTPWYEPFGITPLEAMACGTPVIGSDVGGIKYTVAHGETGFLVPPQDPAAIAERAAELIRNPELRERLSQEAIRRVNEHFTWAKVSQQLEEVFSVVLGKQRLASTHLPEITRGFALP